MDPTLQGIVLDRLEAVDDERVVDVVLAACEGAAALEAVLGGGTIDRPAPAAAGHAVEPPGAYLQEVTVEGFRGIGPAAGLTFAPGPGLTLVVGRNGSGKSSFAEGTEMLFTGRNHRWSARSQVWREGWRNLHHPDPVRLEASLLVDGRAGVATVSRRWAPDDALDAGRTAGLDEAAWADSVDRYRPFLSYNELGAMFDGKPTEFYDALSAILGLGELVEADRLLSDAKRPREALVKDVRSAVPGLIQRVAGVDDERARAVHLALAGRKPDLDAVELALLGAIDGLDPEGEVRALRDLTGVTPPVAAERVQALAAALRDAADQLDGLAETDAERSQRLARLLDAALAVHAAHGDLAECPVCHQPPGLDTPWRIGAEAEADDARRRAESAVAATAQADQLLGATRRLVDLGPPDALVRAPEVGVPVDDALAAWASWQACADRSLRGLAEHVERTAAPLEAALADVRRRAGEQVEQREDAWRPAALLVAEWLARARSAAEDAPRIAALKAAQGWFKETAAAIRAERFAPLADEARENWELLRQGSNVSLDAVSLEGVHSAATRRVAVGVTVDGVDAAALGVMSQGELHALALSLFLPRAGLAESPFRFMVIDDPVQSMDPAKVDGLARVLERAARTRQLVVFTHDDRLPEAVRRLGIPARVVEVTRRAGSVVEVRGTRTPVEQALEDARALIYTDGLPPETAARVVPGFCRIAIEAACVETVRRRRLARGETHADVERALDEARTLYQKAALALFDDVNRGSDVLGSLDNRFGGRAADAFRRSNSGAHVGDAGSLPDLVRDAAILARDLVAVR